MRHFKPAISIYPLSVSEFDEFIIYLNEHLAENGTSEIGYFQPLSRATSSFPSDRETAFRAGLEKPIGLQGWRRAWVARSEQRKIIGHIDLRSYPEMHTEHRCLLGIGVERLNRRFGIGKALIQHAKQWATNEAKLDWIDLQVLSTNEAALTLYRSTGFTKVGEIPNMFKFDGQSFSYTTMTIMLSSGASHAV